MSIKRVCISIEVIAVSEQTTDSHKEFITVLVKIRRNRRRCVVDRAGPNYGWTIMMHLPTPHQLKHVSLKGYVNIYK